MQQESNLNKIDIAILGAGPPSSGNIPSALKQINLSLNALEDASFVNDKLRSHSRSLIDLKLTTITMVMIDSKQLNDVKTLAKVVDV